MYIRSVRVRDFGTIDALDLDLDDGINVICGPNEAGKSTLMKAIWFALTRRARSRAAEIKAIVPRSGGTPQVELVMENARATYELTKRFDGSSSKTTLRINEQGSIRDFQGDEADEQLRQALGFGEASGRSGEPGHVGLWPVTWVRQHERGLDPGACLEGRGDSSTISQILAEASGEVLAGSDGSDVVDRAYEEYQRFYTDSGNETSKSGAPLHEARQRLAEKEERLRELSSRDQGFSQNLAAYDRLQRDAATLEQRIPELKAAAAQAGEQAERVQKLQEELRTAQARLETARHRVDQVRGRVDRREELQEELKTLAERQDEQAEKAGKKRQLLAEHEAQREEIVRKQKAARQDHADVRRAEKRLRAHLEALQHEERLADIREKLEEVDKYRKDLTEITRTLAGIPFEAKDVEALDAAERRRTRAETRLESAAARVRLTALEDVDLAIQGEPVSLAAGDEKEQRIDERTAITVGDALRIELEPGGEDLETIRQAASEAREAFEEALQSLGVESVSDARQKLQEKNRLTSRKDELTRRIDRLAPQGRAALDERRVELEAQLDTARQTVAQHSQDEDGELPRNEADARRELKAAEKEKEAAAETMERANQAVVQYEKRAQELQAQARLAARDAESLAERIDGVAAELEAQEKEHGTEQELSEALKEASGAFDKHKQEVARMRRELDALDPKAVAQEKARAEAAVETTKQERQSISTELHRLEGQLTASELHGLHEQLEAARAEKESAAKDVQRLEQQAAAAKLLYETLQACRSEARQRYLAPLQDEVEDLLTRFFRSDGSRIEFGEQFDVDRLNRGELGSFEFGELSSGAREQLGLLLRLGMARLIAREAPHPVFLDDTLADTDPDRFRRMATIFHSLKDELQIIITTCHKNRYRELGVPTKDIEALKREASVQARQAISLDPPL